MPRWSPGCRCCPQLCVTVYGCDLQPWPGATVTVTTLFPAVLVASGVTDASGQVCLNVDAGSYNISATATGWLPPIAPQLVFVGGTTNTNAEIILVPPEGYACCNACAWYLPLNATLTDSNETIALTSSGPSAENPLWGLSGCYVINLPGTVICNGDMTEFSIGTGPVGLTYNWICFGSGMGQLTLTVPFTLLTATGQMGYTDVTGCNPMLPACFPDCPASIPGLDGLCSNFLGGFTWTALAPITSCNPFMWSGTLTPSSASSPWMADFGTPPCPVSGTVAISG